MNKLGGFRAQGKMAAENKPFYSKLTLFNGLIQLQFNSNSYIVHVHSSMYIAKKGWTKCSNKGKKFPKNFQTARAA